LSNKIIGWDIGGAHIKAVGVDASGNVTQVVQYPCPLWLGLSHLHECAVEILQQLADSDPQHAITMSGELVDLFPNRHAGVEQLLSAIREHIPVNRLSVFAGPSGLVRLESVNSQFYAQIASANWLASAQYAASSIGSGLFVDIGSTTTDILTIRNAKVDPQGYSDYERLQCGELVYTGVVRTPVMAISNQVYFQNKPAPLVAELFATMADVYRITGELPEYADQWPAADNGEKDKIGSARRLARMLGRDLDAETIPCWEAIATFLRSQQLAKINSGCNQQLSRDVLARGTNLVGAGVGRFLAKRLAQALGLHYIDFSSLVSCSEHATEQVDIADNAPAVAVAKLLYRERMQ